MPETALRRSEAILDSVRFAAERLLGGSGRWDEGIEDVLARLGEAAEVSRVYVFQTFCDADGRHHATQLHEWVAAGATAQIDNCLLVDLDYRQLGWSRWVEVLGSGEVVHGRTRDFPDHERPELEAEDILAIALVPIMVGPAWWGFIGFDECVAERDWRPEISALRAAASTLAAAIQRERARDELRATEAQYIHIVDSTSDGIVVTDLDGRFVAGNDAFLRMHGWTTEPELRGLPATTWIHPDFHHLREDHRRAVAEGRDFRSRAVDVRRDGTTFPVEVHGSEFTFLGSPHSLWVVRDDTERSRAFDLLETRVAALAGIAATLTVDEPLDATLARVAARAVAASSAVAAAVQLVDQRTNDLRLVACHGLPDGYAQAMQESWRLGVDAPTTQALRSQQLAIIRGAPAIALENPRFAPLHPLLRQVEWDTVVAMPLDAAGRNLGAFNLYFLAGEDPDADELSFLRAVADQAAAAVENARLYTDAQSKAGLEERQRLARELHDSVSQALYGIALGAKTARTLADQDPSRLVEPLDYVLSLAEAALAEMRALIFELRPESLEQEGLVAALDRQAASLRARHGIAVVTSFEDEPGAPLEVKEAVYRISQEALHNIAKHANAAQVLLSLTTEGDRLRLRIEDDGAGFDPSGTFPGHLGLTSMRERATLVGGRLDLQSAPGAGCQITFSIATDGRS